MAKKALIVAFHFPPQSGSSGRLRSLKFVRYLPQNGWLPVVLSAHARAYERLDDSQVHEIPTNVKVLRSFALDARSHLAWRGRYPRWLALPDRWASWTLSALPVGLNAIRRENVEVIFTTYPLATTILIGYFLHLLSGKPWVVDFRDPMTEDKYPSDPLARRVYRWIEAKAMRHGACFVFTTESTRQTYLSRYPGLIPERCFVISNGYDEEDFADLESSPSERPSNGRPLRILHSGVIYPRERDPRPFFAALSRLKSEGKLMAGDLRIDLRAPGSEKYYSRIVKEFCISDLVHLLPPLPYRESLADAAEADVLLILQHGSFDHQIPAKVYEYLRLRKPILALTSQKGDTAALLRDVGGATIFDLMDEAQIHSQFPLFLGRVRNRTHSLPESSRTEQYSRRYQAFQLSQCFSLLKA